MLYKIQYKLLSNTIICASVQWHIMSLIFKTRLSRCLRFLPRSTLRSVSIQAAWVNYVCASLGVVLNIIIAVKTIFRKCFHYLICLKHCIKQCVKHTLCLHGNGPLHKHICLGKFCSYYKIQSIHKGKDKDSHKCK